MLLSVIQWSESAVLVQSFSNVWLFWIPWTIACQASLSFTIHVHWASDAIQQSHPLPPSTLACLQSFPASRSFPMSWLFVTGGQSIGAAASGSVLPMNIHWESLPIPSDMFLSFARTSFLSGTTDVPASACIFPLSILNEGILWF